MATWSKKRKEKQPVNHLAIEPTSKSLIRIRGKLRNQDLGQPRLYEDWLWNKGRISMSWAQTERVTYFHPIAAMHHSLNKAHYTETYSQKSMMRSHRFQIPSVKKEYHLFRQRQKSRLKETKVGNWMLNLLRRHIIQCLYTLEDLVWANRSY